MKKLIIIPLLLICLLSSATTYYVSTTGSNNNSGTLSSPFATLNKAWSVVTAGDIIYVRGGTYTYAMMGQTTLSGKSGTSGNPITIQNYPGESPVINFSANTFTSQVIGIAMQNANYIRIKGLRITSINQPHDGSAAQYGIMLWDHVSNCTFEQMEIDHIGGWGVTIGDWSSDNLFLNCDSHHNSDRYTSNGDTWGWSDGFQSASWNQTSGQASTRNTFRGCRSYWNSDDGWDLRRVEGFWTWENCWSFWNGYQPGEKLGDADSFTEGGNGEGIKLTGNFGVSTTEVRRTILNAVVFENRTTAFGGWADNAGGTGALSFVGVHIYNSIAYKNGVGWGWSDETGPSTDIFRNNISYANTNGNYWPSNIWFTHDHNSWDSNITLTNADFQSVNSAGMDGPRPSDGSLPNTNFLHLVAGSKFIDAGVNVGMSYSGNSPDLGAFEGGTGSTVTIPAYTSSAVQSATPSLLEITYNIALANIVPVTSAFIVNVNSVTRPVSSVVISGTKVQLTLATSVIAGDVITVSYTKPSANPVQTTSGGQAVTITAQAVTNNVISVIPVYVSSAVSNATPTILDMTYNMTLANVSTSATAFKVYVNSVLNTVSSLTISGSKVKLTLSSAIKYGDIITVAYTKPATNPLQATTGGAASTFSAQMVINNMVNTSKDGTPLTITMNISPNHVHHIINIALAYSGTAISPENVRILDYTGKLFIEKLLVTGATAVKISVNLARGIYTVQLLSGGLQMASQKIMVY